MPCSKSQAWRAVYKVWGQDKKAGVVAAFLRMRFFIYLPNSTYRTLQYPISTHTALHQQHSQMVPLEHNMYITRFLTLH